MLEALTSQLAAAKDLTNDEVTIAVEQLVAEQVSAALKADFLAKLAQKGETTAEIGAFARALRGKAIEVPLDAETRSGEILDVVGTGGDLLGTFNISTTVAILCAAAGVRVAKHGNRAATSRCGSADVLEALGIPIHLSPAAAAQAIRDSGFAFLFAPDYHPAFKHIGSARKLCAERGQRTVFNLLGPLLNPARPSAQLVGVPRPSLCEPMALVLQSLGVRRAMVVCGRTQQGETLDEISTLGETTIAEFYQERGFAVSTLSPEHFSLQGGTLNDLLGGDCEASALIVRDLLENRERGPKRDAVLLNAAAALMVAGKSRSLTEGWALAEDVIESGKAHRKLAELRRP